MSVFTSSCMLIGSSHHYRAQHHENLVLETARLDQSEEPGCTRWPRSGAGGGTLPAPNRLAPWRLQPVRARGMGLDMDFQQMIASGFQGHGPGTGTAWGSFLFSSSRVPHFFLRPPSLSLLQPFFSRVFAASVVWLCLFVCCLCYRRCWTNPFHVFVISGIFPVAPHRSWLCIAAAS